MEAQRLTVKEATKIATNIMPLNHGPMFGVRRQIWDGEKRGFVDASAFWSALRNGVGIARANEARNTARLESMQQEAGRNRATRIDDADPTQPL